MDNVNYIQPYNTNYQHQRYKPINTIIAQLPSMIAPHGVALEDVSPAEPAAPEACPPVCLSIEMFLDLERWWGGTTHPCAVFFPRFRERPLLNLGSTELLACNANVVQLHTCSYANVPCS